MIEWHMAQLQPFVIPWNTNIFASRMTRIEANPWRELIRNSHSETVRTFFDMIHVRVSCKRQRYWFATHLQSVTVYQHPYLATWIYISQIQIMQIMSNICCQANRGCDTYSLVALYTCPAFFLLGIWEILISLVFLAFLKNFTSNEQ